jgi:peptidoglycan/xylan/chitin deacetylase (PgdA/CDA1 family)
MTRTMGDLRARARRVAQEALKHTAAAVDRIAPPPRGAVVLIYHRVGRRTQLEIDMPSGLFDEQIAALAESNRAATLDAALEAVRGPAPGIDPVVVTFDDGTRDFVDDALPLLVHHRVPCVLYVATDFIESGRPFPDDGAPLSWNELADALSTGLVTIGSHTHSHALLDRLADERIVFELERSIELVQTRLGVNPDHFAYPKALAGSAAAQRAVREHFVSAALAGTRPNGYGSTDPYRLARSPVQYADGLRWFEHKLAGGMRVEDDVRRIANRVRYAGATT